MRKLKLEELRAIDKNVKKLASFEQVKKPDRNRLEKGILVT